MSWGSHWWNSMFLKVKGISCFSCMHYLLFLKWLSCSTFQDLSGSTRLCFQTFSIHQLGWKVRRIMWSHGVRNSELPTLIVDKIAPGAYDINSVKFERSYASVSIQDQMLDCRYRELYWKNSESKPKQSLCCGACACECWGGFGGYMVSYRIHVLCWEKVEVHVVAIWPASFNRLN